MTQDRRTRAAGLRPIAEVEELLASKPLTGLQKHLVAFIDVARSRELERLVITEASTAELLRALGVGTVIGARLMVAALARIQKTDGEVEFARVHEGIRADLAGPNAHTGIYRVEATTESDIGEIDPDAAASFWLEVTRGKRYLTGEDLDLFVRGESLLSLGLVRFHKVGRVINRFEFQLFFDVAAQVSGAGKRVLTEDRFLSFLDGSIWRDLAEARREDRLYVAPPPREAATQRVAEYIRQRADGNQEGDSGPNLEIDEKRSLREQRRTKLILPVLLQPMADLLDLGFR